MDIQKIIGLRVKEFRKKRNLTQEQLAEKSKLHTTFIAHIESGKKVCSIKSLQKIANALKVPVFLLLQTNDKQVEYLQYDLLTQKLISLVKNKPDKLKKLYLTMISSVSKLD
ncbi:MAG: helix-turn-helix transcriptional regulator [Endomicrobiia bacterium]